MITPRRLSGPRLSMGAGDKGLCDGVPKVLIHGT